MVDGLLVESRLCACDFHGGAKRIELGMDCQQPVMEMPRRKQRQGKGDVRPVSRGENGNHDSPRMHMLRSALRRFSSPGTCFPPA